MSGNEVERLKSLRGKLAVLCPETDGLQAKHRIRRILKGKTREERVEEMLDIVADEVNVKQTSMTKQVARIVSLVFDFVVFTSEEVYHILKNELLVSAKIFSLFRLAKEKYNDEQRYTFYRTAAVWSADFFT